MILQRAVANRIVVAECARAVGKRNVMVYSYGHLPVITGYKWDYIL